MAEAVAQQDNSISAVVSRMFGNHRYFDLTIKCRDQSWQVHKVIVCSRCEFFEAACRGPFKEADSGTITMNGDKPFALGAVLEYLYKDDYDDLKEPQGFSFQLILHAEVLMLADKYNLPALAQLTRDKISAEMDSYLETGEMDSTFVMPIRAIFAAADDVFSKEVKDIIVGKICSTEGKMESSASMTDATKSVPRLAAAVALLFLKRFADPVTSQAQVEARRRRLLNLAT